MEKKILELAKTYLKDNYSFLYNKECNAYEFEVYTDYTDVMDSDMLLDYLKKGYDRMSIIEELYDSYLESMNSEEDFVLNRIYEYIENIDDSLLDDFDTMDLRELLVLEEELFYVTVDFDRIINGATIPINIMLESDESFNREFGHNEFTYDINEYFEYVEENINAGMDKEDFSIITLIESQGYTVEEFLNYVNDEKASGNKFFDSLYNEYLNVTSGCNSLVVHRYMTLDEYEELKNQKTIEISTSDIIGYVSHIFGAGSLLEISLDRPFKVDSKDCKIVIDGAYGYGVTDIYGWLKSA